MFSLPGDLRPWAGEDETVCVMGTVPVPLDVEGQLKGGVEDIAAVVTVVVTVVNIFR